jgi:hypothetical protein
MKHIEWAREQFLVTCDPARLDHSVIAQFLGSSYWAAGIPAATLARSLANSLCFGLFERERQIGFARIITDYAPSRISAMSSCCPTIEGAACRSG